MSKISPNQINDLIKNRRSVFPASYIEKPIPKEIIQQVLENANWAPTHKLTEPWRFKVFSGAATEKLGVMLSEVYQSNTPAEKFKEMKFKKIQKNGKKSGAMIAICMQRDPKESIPEWEEIAAVGCAVQNMYLTCEAYEVGCYWSSPGYSKYLSQPLGLNEGERCLGFFYMGYYEMERSEGMRRSIGDKVVWMK